MRSSFCDDHPNCVTLRKVEDYSRNVDAVHLAICPGVCRGCGLRVAVLVSHAAGRLRSVSAGSAAPPLPPGVSPVATGQGQSQRGEVHPGCRSQTEQEERLGGGNSSQAAANCNPKVNMQKTSKTFLYSIN